MSRKRIAILLIAAILCGMLGACGQGTANDNPSSATTEQENDTSANGEVTTGKPGDNVDDPNTATDTTGLNESNEGSVTNPSGNGNNETTPVTKPSAPSAGGSDVDETEESGPLFPEATNVSVPESNEITYLDYHNMSADEQKAFINSFDSVADFVAWHAAAKQAFEESMIEGDGSTPVDAGAIVGGN